MSARRFFHSPQILLGLMFLLISTGALAADPVAKQGETEYLVGGPLAGIKLPLYPTYHGEAAGRPGNSGNTVQLQLYPNSVENWRAYMGKYMPIRSFFDQQSMVQRWIAPNIPGISQSGIKGQYAQPIYKVPKFAAPTITGQFEPAVDVVTLKPGDTIAEASTGKLGIGMYCVRVVAAVPLDELVEFRDDLFIKLAINDQPGGKESNYRVRVGYCDQFYSLVELYFHAPEAREYKFKLSVGPNSKVKSIIVREVIVDDALAGIQQKAIKTKSNNPLLATQIEAYRKNETTWAIGAKDRQERLDRDEALWNNYPKTNKPWTMFLYRSTASGLAKHIHRGALGKDMKALGEEYGSWVAPKSPLTDVMLHNDKLKLDYTWADYNAGKPLPDPYPIKDDGVGIAKRADDSKTQGQFFFDVAVASSDRMYAYENSAFRIPKILVSDRPDQSLMARDGLISFIRFAYEIPSYDFFNALDSQIKQTGGWGRDWRNRRRDTPAWHMTWYTEYAHFAELYDRLFPLIQGNEELAQSVHRFIPWVNNSQDLVKLFDSYFVQHIAKKILRYHYHTYPSAITQLASVLGDKEFTNPWMEWQFSRAWSYPFPLAGIQDYVVTAMDRSGVGRGGTSSFYAGGKAAYLYAEDFKAYEQATGDHTFTLLDPERNPKVYASLEWPIQLHYAGIQYIRIGDVTGPEKPVGHLIKGQLGFSREAWAWTHDPRHAKILATYDNPKSYTDQDWATILKAADTQKRLPYYDQRSRYLPNWAGILETGQQHDELSFRRGAALRTGRNYGHQHEDSLDLQISAHGLPMVLDGGQRPGYTEPASRNAAVHNMVTYDNHKGGYDEAWVRSLSDTSGVQYMLARRGEPTGATRGDRQVALIDVGEGEKSTTTDDKGNQVVAIGHTPNSYVMDVFRIGVGKAHHYNFHAMVNDDFQWNAKELKAISKNDSLASLKFPDNKNNAAGVAPENFVATWRMQKEVNDISTNGTEQGLLSLIHAYDPKSPHKFLRLHLFDTQGMAVNKAQFYTNKPAKNQMTMISVTNTPAKPKEGSVFVGIVEPYAGEPFITKTGTVAIKNNETDDQRAVAIQVNTVNGHDDLLMADGRPDKTRQVEGNVSFAGDFALISSDKQGLRLASITGGTLLHSPAIRLNVDTRAHNGNIIAVNYLKKQITIDQPWPARSTSQLIEVGDEHKMTAYTLTSIKPQGSKTVLTTLRGADYFLSPIKRIDIDPVNLPSAAAAQPEADETSETSEAAQESENTDDNTDVVTASAPQGPVVNKIIASLALVPSPGAGRTKNWVLSNEDATKFWRADITSNIYAVIIKVLNTDTPLGMSDFGPSNKIRLWEYGIGDQVQQRTTASVSRASENTYRLSATSNVTLSLPGSKLESSADNGKTWSNTGQAKDGWVTASFTADQTADAPLLIRVSK